MSTASQARRDAREVARAQMFYGEGAGNRRKLIAASVQAKIDRDPAYGRAFRQAIAREDMAEHASEARKERRRLDRNDAISRNTRAVMTGNKQSMQTSVLVATTIAYFAHQTGLDKKVYEKGRALYHEARARYRGRRRTQAVIYNITNVHREDEAE